MSYIPRQAEKLLKSALNNSKILILLGARQVGKTTLLNHLIANQKDKIYNLDIEVDKAELLVAKSLSPQEAIKNLGNPQILIIDEAQRLPEISQIVKGWFDSGLKTKIILSGSSSLNLLDQSAEALTGRNQKILLPPLIFQEILKNQSWYQSFLKQPNLLIRQTNSLLLQSIVFGSYPEAVTTENKNHYLVNLTSDYLLKDIFQSGMIKNPDFIKRLLLLLAHQIGSLVSVNELASTLQASRQTVEKYLDLLEQTFVLFRLNAYSSNPRKEIAKSKKIYFWDTGVRNALIKEFNLSEYRSDLGLLWENWIIAEFAKQNLLDGNLSNLYFWRNRNGAEVDLIIKKEDQLTALEIKWSSRKNKGSAAFNSAYHIMPEIITKDNFLNYILR